MRVGRALNVLLLLIFLKRHVGTGKTSPPPPAQLLQESKVKSVGRKRPPTPRFRSRRASAPPRTPCSFAALPRTCYARVLRALCAADDGVFYGTRVRGADRECISYSNVKARHRNCTSTSSRQGSTCCGGFHLQCSECKVQSSKFKVKSSKGRATVRRVYTWFPESACTPNALNLKP